MLRINSMKYVNFLVFLVLLNLGNSAIAAETDLKYGIFFGATNMAVDDPEGDTNPETSTSNFNIAIMSPLTGGKRLFVHGYNYYAKLEADTVNLGQEVTITGATVSLQFDVMSFFWVGAGVGITKESYTNRHTTDVTGEFLVRSVDTEPNLADEDFTTYPLVFSLSKEWEINRALSFGAHVTYTYPLQSRAKYLTVLLGVYF